MLNVHFSRLAQIVVALPHVVNKMNYKLSILAIPLVLLLGLGPCPSATAQGADPGVQSAKASITHLARMMDQFHSRFPVYFDVSSAGNHFHAFAKIPDGDAPVTVNGSSTNNPHSGATAIRFQLLTGGGPYGGFYFQNGVLPAGATAPQLNFGTVPNAGINLSGATALTFWARGEVGGEQIEFFMGGVGRDADTGAAVEPYPDSTPRRPGVGTVCHLTTAWQKFTIDLTGASLNYVLGGFAWVATIANNPGGAVFYVDDIQYELNSTRRNQRLNEAHFVPSFTTEPFQSQPPPVNDFDLVLRNSAFTYDNAVALLAFLADGSPDSLRRARIIGNAFVYASQHDRSYDDGRLRSDYAAGDISLPPGWTPNNRVGTVPVPGFYDEAQQKFIEIEQKAVDTGNNAWAMIALLALYQRTSNHAYLDAARKLGDFIHTFRNDAGTYRGFQGGLDDYPEGNPPGTRRAYASTEHNLDVYAAFLKMYQITGESKWLSDAQHARRFVDAMWNTPNGCYLAGTTDPETRNTNAGQLPLDVQAWSVLALPNTLSLHPQVLSCAELNHRNTHDGFSGFDFNDDRDGVWFEGTAQMTVAYAAAAQSIQVEELRQELSTAQMTSPYGDGYGTAAACHDGLSTGFDFKYFRRLHIGATAWNVFAQLGFNPYYQTKLRIAFDISGRVTLDGNGLGGVKMILNSPTPAGFTQRSVLTSSDGSYSLANVPGGRNYTLTPSKTNYTFTPASRSYTNLKADKTLQNFTATLKTYTVSGIVKLGSAGLSGVTVKLESPTPAGFASRTTTTGSQGAYSFANVPAARDYTVTPAKTGYQFTPASKSLTNLSAGQTAVNFAVKVYSITGRVTLSGTTTGISVVTMTLTSPTPANFPARTAQTGNTGYYTFTNLPAGRNYSIKPSKSGFTFAPAARSFTNLSGNIPAGASTSFTGTGP